MGEKERLFSIKGKSERRNYLKTFKTVREWFSEVAKSSGSAQPPEATERYYLAALDEFCLFTSKTPDELIAEAKKEARLAKEQLNAYWVERSKQSKTSASLYFRALRSFYRFNGVQVGTKTPRTPTVREKEILLLPYMKYKVHSGLKNGREILYEMVSLADPMMKAWIAFQCYAGLRIEATTLLQVKHLNREYWVEQATMYPVNITEELSGTFDYKIWIGEEAKKYLDFYLNMRNAGDEDYVFPVSTQVISRRLRALAHKIGLVKSLRGVAPFRSHCFRKRLQTLLEKSGMPLNWVDHCLGHVPRGAQAKAYSKPPDEDIEAWYRKAYSLLRIEGAVHIDIELEIEKRIQERFEEYFRKFMMRMMMAQAEKAHIKFDESEALREINEIMDYVFNRKERVNPKRIVEIQP